MGQSPNSDAFRNLERFNEWLRGASRSLWWTVMTGVLAGGSMVLLALNIYQLNSLFSLISLTSFGLLWLFLALMNGRSWRQTLDDWGNTLRAWEETSHAVGDITSLLDEALAELSTWDREKTEEIAGRAMTVMKMRQQNIQARLEKEDV